MPLTPFVEALRGRRVVVAGDFLLDEFVFGEISRVSREAPVLILSHRETDYRPGGAANTVANVRALDADPLPVGFLGDDEWAIRMTQALPSGIRRDFLFRDSAFRTTRKSRILAGSFQSFRQQLVRLDHEYPFALDQAQSKKLCDALEETIPHSDAVILSDYSLGNLPGPVRNRAIELAHLHGKPIAVDSRDDPGGFSGATTVTPNVSELEQVMGRALGTDDARLAEAGKQAREEWRVQVLLVTRGKHGMTLIHPEGVLHLPVHGSDEVADVTGAGDTVIAVYTTALAAGASHQEAARLANRAGGLVVLKRGTATVSAEELRQSLKDDPEP